MNREWALIGIMTINWRKHFCVHNFTTLSSAPDDDLLSLSDTLLYPGAGESESTLSSSTRGLEERTPLLGSMSVTMGTCEIFGDW